jgi:hypothetical protein
MQKKARYFHKFWHDDRWIEENVAPKEEFDYHQVDAIRRFEGSHPAVMNEIIAQCDWEFDESKIKPNFTPREWFLYQIERITGYRLGEYKNYRLI